MCYYVDATAGNDASPGTSARPFRTLQHAADLVNPGDGVVVKDGVYTGGSTVVTISRSGTAANWIVFRAAHRWGAVVDGQPSPVGNVAGRYVDRAERSAECGRLVAELLLRRGADVNTPSGPENQTPLHMAARRGNELAHPVTEPSTTDASGRDAGGSGTPPSQGRRRDRCASGRAFERAKRVRVPAKPS